MTNRPSLLLAASLLLCAGPAGASELKDAKSKSVDSAYTVFHDGCTHDGTDYMPYGRRTRRRGLGAESAIEKAKGEQGPYGPYGYKKKDEAKPADMWGSGTKPVQTKSVQSGNVAKIKCNIRGSTNKTNKSGSYASAGGLANYYGSWGAGTHKSPKDAKAETVTVVAAATGSKSKKIYAGSASGAGGSWGTGDYADYPVKDHKAETVAVVASKSAKVYTGSAAVDATEPSWGSGTVDATATGSKSAKAATVKDYKAKSQKSMSMADCTEVEKKDGAGSKSAKAAIVTANGDAKAKSHKSKEDAVVGGTASWSKPVTRNGETTWGAADAPATTNGVKKSGKATKPPATTKPATAKPKVKCKKTKSSKVAGNTVSATSSWGAGTSHLTTKPTTTTTPAIPPIIPEPEVVVDTSRTVDACDALAANRLVSTDRPSSVGYVYEAVVASDVSLKRVVANAEFSIGQYVGRAMMGCDGGRGRDLLASIGLRISQEDDESEKRRLEDETVVSTTNVVGLSDAPRDSSDTGGGCGYFVGTRAVKDEGCYTVTGGMTLYLTEDDYSDYPPADTSETVKEEEDTSTGTSKPIIIVEEDAASTGSSETVIVVEEDASAGTSKPLSDEPLSAEEDLVGSIGTDKPITITITAPISDEDDDSIGTSKELISAEEDFVGSIGTDKPLLEEGDAVGSFGTSKPLLEARLGGRRRMNEEEAAVDALKVLMDAMNSESSPFVQGSGTRYAVDGLIAVRLVSGTTDGGTTIDIEADDIEADDPPPPPPAVDGAKTTIQVSKNEEPMSPVGISLITIGIIALVVALAMFAMKKRRGHESFAILKDDTDTDLDEDSVNGAEFGTRGRQGAYVVGEEGSVYTTQTTNTRDLFNSLGLYDEGGNGNDDGEQVDVHQCTSATCPICTARRGSTVFVPAVDDGPDGEAYEVDYRRSTGPAQGRDGSFEYKSSGSGASRPQFLNPAEIGRRPYEVGDTVDF